MRNRVYFWDEIKILSEKYWELFQKVKKLEDDAFLNDRITKESLKQFDEIYSQMKDIHAEKLEVFRRIYEVSKQTDLFDDE
jgi:hypothetical protein